MNDKIYGIDLGTTNSLIGYGDTLLTGLVPSVVLLDEKKAGADHVENDNAVRSFKVNISLGLEGNMSVVASSIVLRTLKELSGEDVKKVVVAVPAYFTDNQRQATIQAAKLAGLEVVNLINEPTAAAIYLAKNRKALTLVYDLGGGTFDASVVDSRFDSYDVQATDGYIIGGDDLDAAIMRSLIKIGSIRRHTLGKSGLARLLRLSTQVKLMMQKERATQQVDLRDFGAGIAEFTASTYVDLMRMTFAETIIRARKVLNESIPFGEEFDIILVGGSTRCPYLREWLTDELGKAPVNLDYDPDLVVAQGAAFYARMLEKGEAETVVSDITKALSIGLADGTVATLVPKNSKIPIEETTILYNHTASSTLRVDLFQGEALLASMNECIGTLAYDYGEVKPAGKGEVIIGIRVDSSGIITLSCKELLKDPVQVVLDRRNVSI
jgi:molecular chaperone DnaK (HSP70)